MRNSLLRGVPGGPESIRAFTISIDEAAEEKALAVALLYVRARDCLVPTLMN